MDKRVQGCKEMNIHLKEELPHIDLGQKKIGGAFIRLVDDHIVQGMQPDPIRKSHDAHTGDGMNGRDVVLFNIQPIQFPQSFWHHIVR